MLLAILVAILIFVALLTSSSPEDKGEKGERIVRLEAESMLDKDKYHLLNNVTLRTGNGTTQIDHIIVSAYGVFVVETKNMAGWIFGNPKQRTWTQVFYKDRYKFQNPLHQNYKHVKTLKSLLILNSLQLHSLVVFVGGCEFKTEMPENVTYLEGFIEYIESKQQPVLVESEVFEIIATIATERLEPSLETDRRHVKYLRNKIAKQ
jgi:restriction system protein